jgi:hypothetical protein
MVNIPCTAKKTLVSLDAVTQRRQHGFLSLRGFNSRPVWPVSLCVLFSPCGHYRRLLLALLRYDSLPSTFLPPVPRRCFALSASRGSSPLRYHEGSDSCTVHLRHRSPHLLRHTFLSFRLQPRGLPGHRFPPRQRDPRVSDFAMYEQARRSAPPNRVRPPTDRQFASGCSPPRLATTQLPSASESVASSDTDFHRADAAPSWAHSYRRRPVTIFAYTRRPKKTWIPACAGMTKRRADIERKILNLAN